MSTTPEQRAKWKRLVSPQYLHISNDEAIEAIRALLADLEEANEHARCAYATADRDAALKNSAIERADALESELAATRQQLAAMQCGPLVFVHKDTGEVRHTLSSNHDETEWDDARIVYDVGASALQSVIDAAVAPYRLNADRLREALSLVLPLAIGYSSAHNVGRNAAYCELAQAALAAKEANQ